MRHTCRALLVVAVLSTGVLSAAEEFNITEFGATANDATDDTSAIEDALTACGQVGGGTVFVPAGTFILCRRNAESPILEVPPNTTVRGEGTASTLKFAAGVNESNFWRMIGAPVAGGTKNVVIRDLHLDGSNTHPKYDKGKTRMAPSFSGRRGAHSG